MSDAARVIFFGTWIVLALAGHGCSGSPCYENARGEESCPHIGPWPDYELTYD